MKVHDAVLRALVAEDINTIFGLISEDTLELLASLKANWSDTIDLIETRHEQGAMAMADGYARTSSDIGVCIVGRGPAIAQTGTSLVTARKNGSNVLVIVPESPIQTDYDVKEFDQTAYLQSTAGSVLNARASQTVLPRLRDGIRRARTGQGPVAVQIPWDLLDSDMQEPADLDTPHVGQPDPSPPRLQPASADVESAVDAYLDADATVPPIILAGRGAVNADAYEELTELAERTGGLLATTLQARGYFADHPYGIGFIGEWGTDLANTLTMNSGCVFAFGCSLNPHTTDHGHVLRDDATVIQVDADPTQFGQYTAVDTTVTGDAAAAATALDDALAALDVERRDEFWTADRRAEIEAADPLDGRDFPADDDRMDPRELIRRLDAELPEDRVVITDGGHFTRWVVDGIATPSPRDFHWTLNFAAIGQGLGVGLGAATAVDSRPCVAVCGDAGFMMAIQELETAVRHDIPLTIIVINDSALGSEYHNLAPKGGYAEAALIESPAFAAIAESFGAEGHTVRELSDLDALDAELQLGNNGPVVIDCHVTHHVRHRSKT